MVFEPTKAICEPSGDHAGSEASRFGVEMIRFPCPSTPMTAISEMPVWAVTKAILCPSQERLSAYASSGKPGIELWIFPSRPMITARCGVSPDGAGMVG